MDEQYESIKNKLKKLLALAERGVQGEAENARRLLEKLCKEYGISIEELLDENQVKYYRFNIGRNAIYKDLFVQCYCKVVQKVSLSYHQASRSQIEVAQIKTPITVQRIMLTNNPDAEQEPMSAIIDGKALSYEECKVLARNDGLSIQDFREWFFGKELERISTFKGCIIQFTDFKY